MWVTQPKSDSIHVTSKFVQIFQNIKEKDSNKRMVEKYAACKQRKLTMLSVID